MEYIEREQLLLDLLEQNDQLSLNRYCRLVRLSRRAAEHLLAKFIRYDIVKPVFEKHKFYFKLKRSRKRVGALAKNELFATLTPVN